MDFYVFPLPRFMLLRETTEDFLKEDGDFSV